jgi:pyridoxal phosphate-dependent aminotransferase EpsN
MSNVLAGIGRGQLEVLGLRVEQRRANAFHYRDSLKDIPGITLMPQAPFGLHTNWLSCFLVDEHTFKSSRDSLIGILDQADIEARPVWKPMHLQPLYAECKRFGGNVATDLFERGICLPSSSSLSEEDRLRVINAIREQGGAQPLNIVRRESKSGNPDLIKEFRRSEKNGLDVPNDCETISQTLPVGVTSSH